MRSSHESAPQLFGVVAVIVRLSLSCHRDEIPSNQSRWQKCLGGVIFAPHTRYASAFIFRMERIEDRKVIVTHLVRRIMTPPLLRRVPRPLPPRMSRRCRR